MKDIRELNKDELNNISGECEKVVLIGMPLFHALRILALDVIIVYL